MLICFFLVENALPVMQLTVMISGLSNLFGVLGNSLPLMQLSVMISRYYLFSEGNTVPMS